MKRPTLILSLTSVVAFIAACSGADQTNLFDPQGSSQFGTDPANGGSTSSGSSGASGSGSSSSGSSSSSGGSTSSSGGSSGGSTSSSGGSTSSSSSSSSSSGGSSSGSSSGGSSSGGVWKSPGVWCGDPSGSDVYCTPSSQVCCAGGIALPPGGSLTCQNNGIAVCATGLAIRCDDKTDCPGGQVCCGQFDKNTGYKSVECATSCGNTPFTTGVRLCDPSNPVDECGSSGASCQPSGSLNGYYICK